MGFPTIGALIKERADPLMAWEWRLKDSHFLLPNGNRGVPASYIETIDLPFNNINVEDGLFGGGSYTYFPGFHDVSAFSVTFYEDNKAATLKFIKEWKALIKDFNTGFYNPPSKFKLQKLPVVLMDSKGNTILEVELQGIWPAETGNLSLDTASTNRVQITQTFSIDDIRY